MAEPNEVQQFKSDVQAAIMRALKSDGEFFAVTGEQFAERLLKDEHLKAAYQRALPPLIRVLSCGIDRSSRSASITVEMPRWLAWKMDLMPTGDTPNFSAGSRK